MCDLCVVTGCECGAGCEWWEAGCGEVVRAGKHSQRTSIKCTITLCRVIVSTKFKKEKNSTGVGYPSMVPNSSMTIDDRRWDVPIR